MSDFLGRLAARQVGTATGVAPRLRSRFEPAAVEVLPADEHQEQSTQPAAPAAARVAVEGRVVPAPAVEQRPDPPRRESSPGEPVRVAPAVEHLTPPVSISPRPITAEPAAPVRPDPALTPSPPLEVSRQPAARAEPEQDVTAAEPVPAARVGSVELEQRGPEPVTLPLLSSFAPPPVTVPRQGDDEPLPRDIPPTTPVVHVTIGRLDVRAAVEAPTPAEPPAKKRTAISLEDYLDRRHGART